MTTQNGAAIRIWHKMKVFDPKRGFASCSTAAEHYRRIASLRAYLLVSHHKPALELFLRGAGGEWMLHEAAGPDASLEIPPLRLTLPLNEVFANVKFP